MSEGWKQNHIKLEGQLDKGCGEGRALSGDPRFGSTLIICPEQ